MGKQFMNLIQKLLWWTFYELLTDNHGLIMKFIKVHQIFNNWMVNHSWTWFMNCCDEHFMNCWLMLMNWSWTFLKVHKVMNFISPGKFSQYLMQAEIGCMQASILRFWKGKGAKGIFSLRKLKISTWAFQWHQDNDLEWHGSNRLQCLCEMSVFTGAFQGHQGNDQRAWKQSPSLPLWNISFYCQSISRAPRQ